MHVSCIILARGGSKGIPKKNIIKFCGKPLLVWTILQAKACKSINSIWVSSDSDEILDVAKKSLVLDAFEDLFKFLPTLVGLKLLGNMLWM